MTELVERLRLDITINHEKARSKVYHPDGDDLWESLHQLWYGLPAIIKCHGVGTITLGALEIRWENMGLEEQVGEGDN